MLLFQVVRSLHKPHLCKLYWKFPIVRAWLPWLLLLWILTCSVVCWTGSLSHHLQRATLNSLEWSVPVATRSSVELTSGWRPWRRTGTHTALSVRYVDTYIDRNWIWGPVNILKWGWSYGLGKIGPVVQKWGSYSRMHWGQKPTR